MYFVTLFMSTLIQKQLNFPLGPRTLNISSYTLVPPLYLQLHLLTFILEQYKLKILLQFAIIACFDNYLSCHNFTLKKSIKQNTKQVGTDLMFSHLSYPFLRLSSKPKTLNKGLTLRSRKGKVLQKTKTRWTFFRVKLVFKCDFETSWSLRPF